MGQVGASLMRARVSKENSRYCSDSPLHGSLFRQGWTPAPLEPYIESVLRLGLYIGLLKVPILLRSSNVSLLDRIEFTRVKTPPPSHQQPPNRNHGSHIFKAL